MENTPNQEPSIDFLGKINDDKAKKYFLKDHGRISLAEVMFDEGKFNVSIVFPENRIVEISENDIQGVGQIFAAVIEYSIKYRHDFYDINQQFKKWLEENGQSGQIEKDRLKEQPASLIASKIIETFNNLDMNEDEKSSFVMEVLQKSGINIKSVFEKHSKQDSAWEMKLPDVAPALWLKRDKSEGLTPPDFICKYYQTWLGRGLTQAHIRHLDNSLYMALHKWLQNNDMPPNIDLPSKREMNDRKLQELGVSPTASGTGRSSVFSPEAREAQRLYEAARRRKGQRTTRRTIT